VFANVCVCACFCVCVGGGGGCVCVCVWICVCVFYVCSLRASVHVCFVPGHSCVGFAKALIIACMRIYYTPCTGSEN
jgi:hypothetical protein